MTNQDGNKQHDVDLSIQQHLLDMRPLKSVVLDTGLVDRNVLQQCALLSFSKESGLHRRIRLNPKRQTSNNTRNNTQHNKHDLPSMESGTRNMLETEGDKPSNDLAESETAVPEGESWCLLGLCVPLGRDQHEAGCDGGFEGPEKDTGSEEGAIIEGRCGAGCCDTPKDDVGAEPFGDWNLLQKVSWRLELAE